MSARWGAWIALLAAEVAVISVRYHWAVLPEERLGFARGLIEPAFPAALATALAVAAIRRRRPESWDGPRLSMPRGPLLCAHLVAFAGFIRSIGWLVIGDPTSSPYPDARAIGRLIGDPLESPFLPCWVGASASMGVAALALWIAAVSPPEARAPWRWPGWGALFVGVGFGAIAVGSGRLTQSTWPDLGRATLWTVHRMLTLISSEVVCRPAESVVGVGDFTVRIAPACSGYEGIGLVLAYLGAYLWFDRRRYRFPRALLLLPAAAVLMWLANALRLVSLVAVGAWVSPTAAIRGFHIQAGWLAFNAVALGLVAVARRSPRLRRGSTATAGGRPGATAAYLAPMLATVATGIITGAFSDGFDRLYPARVLAAVAALVYFRRAYTGLRATLSWQAVAAGVLVFALWLAAGTLGPGASAGGGTPSSWAGMSPALAWVWLIGRVAGSVLVAPLAEELAFRGYLIRRLTSDDFENVPPGRPGWVALVVSSVLFGALHQQWLAGAAAGVVYALAQRRRGELADAVVAHGTTNGLLMAHALATGDWSSWS